MLAQRAKEEAKRSEMNKRSDREGKQQIVSCPLCFLPFRAATIDDHVRIHFLDEDRAASVVVIKADEDESSSEQEFVLPDIIPRADHISPWGTCLPAPVFRPTLEEFQDPMSYIASISSVGKRFGICKIIPPSNCSTWQSPCGLPSSINPNKLSFRTKLQSVHRLKHRASRAEVFYRVYEEWKESQDTDPFSSKDQKEQPAIDGIPVDLWDLLRAVTKRFGPLAPGCDRMAVVNNSAWLDVLSEYMSLSVLSGSAMIRAWGSRADCSGDALREGEFAMRAAKLRGLYFVHLHNYEQDAANANRKQMWDGISEDEIINFGYGTGPVQTLAAFRIKAAEFRSKHGLDSLSEDELERLYWRIVESAESRVEVEYGNDLSVVQYGSGFSADPNDPMSRHPWNLNVLPKLPNSLFHHTQEIIHGVTDPMLYFGMCFTSFAWHVEDQFLYSINYHHTGAPKIWYGCGSDHADGLERVMKNELPELFERHPDLMHQLVTSVTPADLRRSNIPVCKTMQHAGEFVVTFPRGYHCGFNAGFNLAEAVNFAMPDWIVSGVDAIANYKITRRTSAFSHLELMLVCARSFPVTQVSLHLLQEMYRITKEYDELRHSAHAQGVNLYMRGAESNKLTSCCECLTDCYLACVKCACNSSKQVCLGCVNAIDWCKGDCQGKYLLERVPMAMLESLVKKLEARLQLPKLCKLRGCPDCVPHRPVKQNVKSHVVKPLSDPKLRRVISPMQKLGRRGDRKHVLFFSGDVEKAKLRPSIAQKQQPEQQQQQLIKKPRIFIDLTF